MPISDAVLPVGQHLFRLAGRGIRLDGIISKTFTKKMHIPVGQHLLRLAGGGIRLDQLRIANVYMPKKWKKFNERPDWSRRASQEVNILLEL